MWCGEGLSEKALREQLCPALSKVSILLDTRRSVKQYRVVSCLTPHPPHPHYLTWSAAAPLSSSLSTRSAFSPLRCHSRCCTRRCAHGLTTSGSPRGPRMEPPGQAPRSPPRARSTRNWSCRNCGSGGDQTETKTVSDEKRGFSCLAYEYMVR